MAILTARGARRAGSAFTVAALAVIMGPLHAESPLEDAVKATYTYKFAPFVTWPPDTRNAHAFQICVDGADAVSVLLPQATSGQRVDGKPIQLRQVGPGDSHDDCRILYIADPAHAEIELNAARGKPILTIIDGADQERAIIRFRNIDHHIRFDIDAALAAESGLTISSKLLDLAHAVTPAENRP
jgi:YfiR/HmsC-like